MSVLFMKVMASSNASNLLARLDGSIQIQDGSVHISNRKHLRETIHRLAEISALESGLRQGLARYITRLAALELGIIPASIHDLYAARGRAEVPSTFTVPAVNLRALSFDAARAVFRAAMSMNAGAFIFEISRSEMSFTDQPAAEYVTNVLAAAITEGFTGPVFIQGDHYQASARRYAANPEDELAAIRDLARASIAAGFYNIDIDASTLVDLDEESLAEQQAVNSALSAMFTAYIRSLEPGGVTVSVGGEIGEVGGRNSTEHELHAYMQGFTAELDKLAPGAVGLSKVSIQSGTSHGGVLLPDGNIQEAKVDFGALLHLSRVARHKYGMGGAVQHGASTLPVTAFGKFVESEACEIHLATSFQTMLFERLPAPTKAEMYAYLDEHFGAERTSGETDEQFYYKTRKYAIGPFKAKLWGLPEDTKATIRQDWEDQFRDLFSLLGLRDTVIYTNQTIRLVPAGPSLQDYLDESAQDQDAGDLAD